MPITKSRSQHEQQFTVSECETDALGRAVIVRTKRYAFYWLLGEEPVLLQVKDYDGSDVTREVDPPAGMYDRLLQCDQSAG